jgi:hypothetical protein
LNLAGALAVSEEEGVEFVDRASSSGAAAASSTSGQPSTSSTKLGIDWSSFDKFIVVDDNPRYKQVERDGRVFGQLQPMTGVLTYRVFALCYCSNHNGRCSRTCGFKPNVGEPVDMVERVLAHWLMSSDSHDSTESHMKATEL